MARRAAHGVRYAARRMDRTRWSAEWRIPFASLGIDPRKHRRFAFNLTARKTATNQFVMWCEQRDHTRAARCLLDDWDRMVAFYAYPDAHWSHIRTTNPLESPFAALRLRTDAAKRYKRVDRATALIWKLLMVAEKRFRRLRGSHLLPGVCQRRFQPQAIEEQRVLEEVAA